MLGISILPLSISDFGTISSVWYFLFLISLVADVIDACFCYVVPVVLLLFVFIYGY